MGQKTTTTNSNTIPGASAQSGLLQQLLTSLAEGGAGQLGDLSGLAAGDISGPTGADQELIASSIGRARQMAENQLRVGSQVGQAQLREGLAGADNSSREVAANLLQSLGTQNSIDQSVLQAGQQGGQALLNLPFQRANTQLQANQALFQRILGAASPVLQSDMQARLAQGTQTTTQETSGLNPAQIMQAAGSIGAAPFTGGMSLAGLPGAFGGGGAGAPAAAPAQSLVQIPNGSGGFSSFDPSKFISGGRLF